ncbi:unnamed protein product [Ceutorhynchus assimilis]|uniref:Glucose-methanol-choline oxidoreductase N-terminal domain-containing protein n=1 Tax=Ceutorhynchus assimilis TaxID=467358 RepID=A0A9P0DZU0_9CUCU|nr:unnamed protein product [Ceutorhynchus assimilis]
MMRLENLLLCTLIVNSIIAGIRAYDDYNIIAENVEKLLDNFESYTYPTNNEIFFESNEKTADSTCEEKEYDFIIVGAGTAGGVLANRLTEEEDFTVLALEAGDEPPQLSDMLAVSIYLHRTPYNWGYNTTAQKNMCLGSRDNKCAYPRGKMLGGSSSINFGMYVRGHRQNFDHWASLGNPGWSYADVLPYFKKAEHATFDNADRDYHGFDGPQKISVPEDTPLLTEALMKAHIELGKNETDYNGKEQDGVARLQFFLDKNIRASSNHAFIKPVKNRRNLEISVNSYVTKILINGNTAFGVQYLKNGKECTAKASKEVILSAGAINSPQLLMLSGIGPKEELAKHGIELIADLPVGKYLQDHQFFPGIFYRPKREFYHNSILENVKLWTENKRPLTPSMGQQIVSFWNFLGLEGTVPEIELFFFGPPLISYHLAAILGYTDEYIESFKTLNPYSDINVNIELLHPLSEGSVTLNSRDPRDFPLIDPNYFSDPKGVDLELMYEGVKVALKLNETEAFKSLGLELISIPYPTCDSKFEKMSKPWWFCALKTLSSTLFHPISTTRMGPNPETSVVNSKLKVHGIQNLRVVDAGVMPDHISGHPNAATVMIAEKISDEIKVEHLGPPRR